MDKYLMQQPEGGGDKPPGWKEGDEPGQPEKKDEPEEEKPSE